MTLEDLVLNANTGADAIKKAPIVDEDTGLRCLRIGDVSQKRKFENWGFTKTTEEDYKRYKLEVDDIIIARTGNTIGVNCFIEEDVNSVYNNGLIRMKADTSKVYPRYLYYLVSSKGCQDYIQSIAFGTSTQPNMKIKDFLNYGINYQSKDIQKKIIEIIDPIDQRIKTCDAINTVLRNIVGAIFAKMIEDLPSDTSVVPISDKAFGSLLKAKVDRYEGEKIYLATADVAEHSITSKSTKLTYDERPSRANMQPQEWTLWFAKMKDSPKFIFLNDQCDEIVDNCIFSTGFYGIKAERDKFYYLWAFISSNDFEKTKNAYCSGTTMQALNNDGLSKITLPLPDKEVLQRFADTVEPIFNQIHNNVVMSETLMEMRQLLLAKLLAGEIDIE